MLRVIVPILSHLSLPHLYQLGDRVIYGIIYHICRYRRSLVRQNLTSSFPEKSPKEIVDLERKFYHHMVDLIMENIWSYRATKEQMQEHIHFVNLDEVERMVAQKGGVFYLLGHIGNWEWAPEIQHRYKNTAIQQYNVYREQKNHASNVILKYLREKRSGVGSNIEKSRTLRLLLQLKKEGKPFTLGLVSDQKPSPVNSHYWTTFLHHETSFLDGGETLAKRFDYPVVYLHIACPKRGYYEITICPITEDAPSTEPHAITATFARLLEANILEQPEQWLWSHNRWKWKHTYENSL